MLPRRVVLEPYHGQNDPGMPSSVALSSAVSKILCINEKHLKDHNPYVEMSLLSDVSADNTKFHRKNSSGVEGDFHQKYVRGDTEPYKYEYYSQYDSDAAVNKDNLCRLTGEIFEDDFNDTYERRARIGAPPPSVWNCVKNAFSMPCNKGTQRLVYTKNRYIMPHL